MKELRKILMSDPLVSSMNVHPSQEPFVDLVHFDPDIVVDPSLSNRSRYFSFVRLSVANRLSLAKQFLPKGIRFFIKEGYRPLYIQKRAFERAIQRIKENSSNQDLDHLMAEASKYVAPPDVAPHPTGGAVDLTLIDFNGIELDLGTPYDAIPQETDNATFLMQPTSEYKQCKIARSSHMLFNLSVLLITLRNGGTGHTVTDTGL